MTIEAVEYKDWSLKVHKKFSDKPIVAQIELTYQCPIHCVHCYSDCYNNSDYANDELSTAQIKTIIDKIWDAGGLWLTFTGGDPMARKDFVELYDYAKDKGFILSVMSSLVVLTDEILDKMVQRPPFSIEVTLNGVTAETYEKISQVKGSFARVIENIKRVKAAELPIKVKTLISKNNQHEINAIKSFLEGEGLEFLPSTTIFARLDGDVAPCEYRLSVDDILKYNFPEEECLLAREITGEYEVVGDDMVVENSSFYRCAVGTWQWHISPKGRLNICSCVRNIDYDLLEGDFLTGVKFLTEYIQTKIFNAASKCRDCKVWHICASCPGKAMLECGDEQAPIDYFCELAKKKSVILNARKKRK